MKREKANNHFDYDPGSGVIRWKMTRSGVRSGTEAGHIRADGYRVIRFNNKIYFAHRLAWFITHGRWPHADIDHINHDRADNRMSNLREATSIINGRNMKLRKTNKSGVSGVHWDKQTRKWTAQINAGGKTIRLGYYVDFLDAVSARKAAEAKHGYHKNHGKTNIKEKANA